MKWPPILLAVAVSVVSLLALPERHHDPSGCTPGVYRFEGTVRRGETFSRNFGGLVLALVPEEYGWGIDISQGQQHFLEGLTSPMQFAPIPTDIAGWHFRNAANTGPNTGDVNAPGKTRNFLFSPRWPHCKDAEGLEKDGRGTLELTDMELGNLRPGEKATILMMKFTVELEVGPSACIPCSARSR